ncbi:unnamed protein product [Vitrella brassicaformis CCMP3155]|uniref:Protein kinase domain-containing protein n=1 Tax=Vitrella brassicaformis (strain CCMP3155) TaxID=1169540 RepID=A0A0G4EM22_VITBC|nr:unnamed protein product [Vitrella brassicaformis CCMP3155]|eukprot:CEL98027.1 unnamed protein product [Vitrella brassicaformis CCMP3155]
MLAANALQFVAPVDQGGNGYIFKVRSTLSGDLWALKALRKDYRQPTSLFTESEFFSNYEHVMRLPPCRHLCRVMEMAQDAQSFYVIMEWARGEDCERGRVDEEDARHIAEGALRGLDVLHIHGITHGDVSLGNIVKGENGRVMLVDFDNILTPESPKLRGLAGTRQYLAPECFASLDYSPASDLWAVGVAIYFLLTGRFPFNVRGDGSISASAMRQVTSAMRQGVPFLSTDEVSPEAADIVRRLLTADKGKRIPSASDALAHPWFAAGAAQTHSAAPPPSDHPEHSSTHSSHHTGATANE